MTEGKAYLLVVIGSLVLEAILILGLAALHANQGILNLGLILPLALGAYATSLVVMHYDESDRDGR